MLDKYQIELALKTAELLRSVGDEGSRLNSRGKVRFANRHGNGQSFQFGDRVFLVTMSCGQVLVVRV